MLRVSLLGGFGIWIDDTPLTGVDSARLQSLLTFLLLHREEPQSRAHLAFLFWPDTSESQARTNLRNLLYALRKDLPQSNLYINTGKNCLQWNSEAPLDLDVANFEGELAAARSITHPRTGAALRETLERAIQIYKGDLLPGCYEDWIIPLRECLHQAYLATLERLVQLLEEQGDYQAALRYAQRILVDDPLHETTYRTLIRLYALNGDRAGALQVYHTCTNTLQRELGVEPGPTTREAYEKLLRVNTQQAPLSTGTSGYFPMIGRIQEWERVLLTWRKVATGAKPHLVLLRGEAGIGKTRLLENLFQWVSRQGYQCARAHCYAVEGDLAFAPVITWLRSYPLPRLEDSCLSELGRLLPEVLLERPDLPPPPPLGDAWHRQHLFEALAHAVLGKSQPLLLSIDDLQWCDRDTLEWLHFLLRFEPKARLLVAGAYRPEEVGEKHPLLALLQALTLEGQVTLLDLLPFDEHATMKLAAQIAGMEIDREAGRILHRETEGNPLFIIETVRARFLLNGQRVLAEGLQGQTPGGEGLPPVVQSVLEARLAQVSHPARQLAEIAASIGREFSFKLLREASGVDEDSLVHGLDELWQRRIIREHGVDAYDFSHDKLREVAYGGMSAARRRLYHRQIAQGLELLHGKEAGPVSHKLAVHYELGGLPEKAVPCYLRAAQMARQIYAVGEAISLLQQGIKLAESRKPATLDDQSLHSLVSRLWEELGELHELMLQHELALEAFHNAQKLVFATEWIDQARLLRKIGAVFREQRLYAEALQACQQAEDTLERQPGEQDKGWWDEWLEIQVERVWAYYWLAQWIEMEELVLKARPFVEARGSAESRMRFLMASCLMHLRKERYCVSDDMLADSRQSLALSLQSGNLKKKIESHFELGFLLLWRRELDEAEPVLLAALEMAETARDQPYRTLSLTYLTVLYRFCGQPEKVAQLARCTLEAAQVACMPDYIAAARANLAWHSWRLGQFELVEALCLEALSIWRQSPLVYPFQWLTLFPLIGITWRQGKDEEAWAYTQALLEPTQQKLPDRLYSLLETALQAKMMKHKTMRSQMEQAQSLASDLGYL